MIFRIALFDNLCMMEYPVEVRPSSVAGRGVFATRDIKIGERVCFYDGYSKRRSECHKHEMKYAINIGNDDMFVGYIVPKVPGGCGQLINDVAILDVKDTSITTILDSLIGYYDKSDSYNVMFDSDGVNVLATQNIAKDSEVYICYGHTYWFNDRDVNCGGFTDIINYLIRNIIKYDILPRTVIESVTDIHDINLIVIDHVLRSIKELHGSGTDCSILTQEITGTVDLGNFGDEIRKRVMSKIIDS